MSKLAHSNDDTMRAIELNEAERGKIVTTFFQSETIFEWRAYRENDEPDDCGRMRVGIDNTEDGAIAELLMLEDE